MTNRKEWLSNKDIIESARMLDWMHRADDKRYIEHNMKSAELVAYNFERGMSRTSLERIWGSRLVNTVLGHPSDTKEIVKEVTIPRKR
jgi:hypothetical protein